ncbi:NAD(P)-dependent oxidoreductase [Phyllobacterium sp. 1468]|uniref:NAD(P)-dependent oxidoreductase n=1 Tax=Phyllobacterium sp. 1468 TaxID=2817759 RepID=UPI00286D51E5|nr:NAD(P)-dependent oxidoreductase [Phyllobacterium sp. 1468]
MSDADIPPEARFALGGVRIGTGTGNMGSTSWGGPNGEQGKAPLMNTPGINARPTAQMVFKALLRVAPDLPVEILHQKVVDGLFDTGKNLIDYPTEKVDGKRFAILGYGNIGREVARLAKAFGMQVVICARAKHKESILQKGYGYAESPAVAASGADVMSVHLGLGRYDGSKNKFDNADLVDQSVMSALNDNAVLINYDRGELVNIKALEEALSSGKIRHAAIDADIFAGVDGPTGPLVPYLSLLPKHAGKLALLPHAAADTDHPTRVAGSKLAVDQIMDAIRTSTVSNLKGELPEGYDARRSETNSEFATYEDLVGELREVSESLLRLLDVLEAASEHDKRSGIIDQNLALLECIDVERHSLLRAKGLLPTLGKVSTPAGG